MRMRAVLQELLFALFAVFGLVASALAHDCFDRGDCTTAPEKIDRTTAIAGTIAGGAIGYTIYKGLKNGKKDPEPEKKPEVKKGKGSAGNDPLGDDSDPAGGKDGDEESVEATGGEKIFGTDDSGDDGLPPPPRRPV